MFRVLLASILILSQTPSMAQIEKLKTSEDVLTFVRKVARDYGPISAKNGFLRIPRASFDSLAKVYNLQNFEKADLDGNGLTDLIFNGSRYTYSLSDSIAYPLSLAILNFGNDSFCVHDLSLEGSEDIAAHLIRLDNKPYIQTIRITWDRKDGSVSHFDTLMCQYNTFIEKGSMIKRKRKIRRIDYNCSNGLAYYANMTLRITYDSARLIKDKLQGFTGIDSGGVFLTRLDPNTRQRLYGLLEATNFTQLKDSYHIDAYDLSTGTITVTYDNGQEKTISDYGTCGTYGLKALHELLFGLTTSQYWINADPPVPHRIDSLHTDREVLSLIRGLYDDYPFLDYDPDAPVNAVPDLQQRLTAFGQRRWQKADIDGNGHTDLLFNGYLNKDGKSEQYSIIVLSFGGDSLCYQKISGADAFFAARIIRYDTNNYVQIKYLEAIEDSSQKKGYRLVGREDTLTADDGDIVEVPPPALHHMEKLTVREEIGDDSIIVADDTIHWYRNDADPPDIGSTRKDSTNLYVLVDPGACQNLLKLAGGIKFERLDPDLLLPNKLMRFFGSTWSIQYDGGKQSRFESDGLIGSYRLEALESRLGQIKRTKCWKFVSPIHIQ